MEKYLNTLNKSELFKYIEDCDILKAIKCLKGTVKKYNKEDIIYFQGDEVSKLGIVLNGSILITKEDIMGNRNILNNITNSGLFAETFVCSNMKYIPVTVIANENSEVLFLEFKHLSQTCNNNCDFHNKLIQNMLNIIASKNIFLNNKLEILSAKTTRDKLIAYLNMQKNINKSNKFIIPFNRDALADFLNLNRSNMSRELSKMQTNGIIKYKKNKFEILL